MISNCETPWRTGSQSPGALGCAGPAPLTASHAEFRLPPRTRLWAPGDEWRPILNSEHARPPYFCSFLFAPVSMTKSMQPPWAPGVLGCSVRRVPWPSLPCFGSPCGPQRGGSLVQALLKGAPLATSSPVPHLDLSMSTWAGCAYEYLFIKS